VSEGHHHVRVDRPPEEVFDFLASGTDNPRWQPFVVSTVPPDGVAGPGSVFRQRARHPFGFTVSADYRVTVFERPGRLVIEAVSGGPIRPTITYDVAPVGDRDTDLGCTVEYHPIGLGRLARPALALLHPLFAWEASAIEGAERVLDAPAPT